MVWGLMPGRFNHTEWSCGKAGTALTQYITQAAYTVHVDLRPKGRQIESVVARSDIYECHRRHLRVVVFRLSCTE